MTIYLIILPILSSCAISFLHYCIGSPIQGEFYTGRIFSAYGKFISDKYNAFEAKEKKRVWDEYLNWKQKRNLLLEKELKNKSAEESEIIYKDFLQQVDLVYNNVENNMKSNPWSMLGACPICFGTWISLLISLFFVIFVMLPWWYIFICTPAAVIISRYIKIS